MIKFKLRKFILLIGITILIVSNLYLLVLLKFERPNNATINKNINSESKQIFSTFNEQIVDDLMSKKCVVEGNVWVTECAIKLLDRTAAEREWKQHKIETMKHPQINTYNMINSLENEQLKIYNWREGFEKMRDVWCSAESSFLNGSGIPLNIARCQLEFELRAIKVLDNLYYEIIMKGMHDSKGILDFEPTDTQIDSLIKVNEIPRSCIWASESNCK